MKYRKGLKGYSQIRCYGIAFFEKTALAVLLEIKNEIEVTADAT